MDRTGWTLEYVDALNVSEAWRMVDMLQSADKAHADNQRKAAKHGAKGR